ncbi:hypothetical protein ACFY20_30425 [Streptomyces sp. NPDC001312]|uniref:hypothetical protein n=1 Tax=Streptomyces sp. NPDC001312 TaxID=3364561 RepID=UPI0036896F79
MRRAEGVRAYAAKIRENAGQLAAVLETIATNGLPPVEDCTSWGELRRCIRTVLLVPLVLLLGC